MSEAVGRAKREKELQRDDSKEGRKEGNEEPIRFGEEDAIPRSRNLVLRILICYVPPIVPILEPKTGGTREEDRESERY